MPHERLRIFISAVTSEFGKARDALAADLRAQGHTVHVQGDFQQGPDNATLLGALAAYIRDCHAVVCVIGNYCGSSPPASAAKRFSEVLPKEIKEASFTQWEFFLARHSNRRTYVYMARDDYKPDEDAASGSGAALQSSYIEYLKANGVHYTQFSDAKELRIAVLRDEPKIAAEPAPPSRPVAKPIVLPYPSIGDLFKGRDEFMQRLHESITRARGGRTAIVSQALYGLGGIGKTRAALEYAWAHADDYTALLFVVAETPEALRRNLAALAGVLLPQLDTTDDAARLAAVLDWLKADPGWLLVLDNVDTLDALAEVERQLSGLTGGHVVITSRLKDFAAHIEPLQLDLLAVDDATAFLMERTKGRRRTSSDDAAKAREVANDLGRLALALEQAGAYIGRHTLTFAEYQERWRLSRDQVLEWWGPTMTGYPRSVAVTWQTSVAQLSAGGRLLLGRLAWLAPEKVPESLLDVSVPGAEAENLRDAYDDLAAYSLVTRDAAGPFFLVHRLVQDVTRRSLAGEARRRTLNDALRWINAAFAGDPTDVRTWPTFDPLAPHVRTVTTHGEAMGIPEPTGRLMNQLGILLNGKALHADAEPLKRRVLAITEKNLGPDHPIVAACLNNLAQLLQDTNRLVEAEPLMRRALAIDEKYFGPDDPVVSRGLNNLALLLQTTNRLDEAEPLLRRALAISEKSLGSDHREVAINLNNLAQLLKDTNRLDEAEPLLRRALAINQKSFGPDHPEVATNHNNLAQLLQLTNRLAEAEPLMRCALAIDEKSFGPDHPRVAIDLNNLAQLLKATNERADAEPLMRRALAIDEKSFGPDHPAVARDLNNLARLLHDTNRLDEAQPLMRRALAIDEKSFGPDHPEVAIDLNNLAGLLIATDWLVEAEPLLRRVVVIFVEFTRRTGHRHPHLDAAFRNYASVLAAMDKSQAEIEVVRAELERPLEK
jgi:tetratricopeptide (TPR) repeat protein